MARFIKPVEKPASTHPGVLFTMRYPDDEGYVWNTIARSKDAASNELRDVAKCFIAFKKLTGEPTYSPQHMTSVELDCYDTSPEGLNTLKAFVLEHRIKVIVFMSALPSTLNLPFLRKLGVRTINTENDSFDHSKRDPVVKKAAKFLLRRILGRQLHDMHLANAESQSRFLRTHACIPSSRLHIVQDAVDCDQFSPGDRAMACQQTGLDPNRFWVICVAQARPEKRIEMLIRVARKVAAERPDSRIGFVYIGDGQLVDGWKMFANSLGLDGVFYFAGRKNDLVPYYRSANLMVHAAFRESFGLAVVEGMACGLPVVASAATGPSETIIDGTTGALIGLEDFDGFCEAIIAYVDDPARLILHGANAIARANNVYGMARQGKQFAEEIKRFLD